MKAQSRLRGSVVASDAFFPFPDGVEEAAKAGRPRGSAGRLGARRGVTAVADRLGLPWCHRQAAFFLH